jgi:hypothetical protein
MQKRKPGAPRKGWKDAARKRHTKKPRRLTESEKMRDAFPMYPTPGINRFSQ